MDLLQIVTSEHIFAVIVIGGFLWFGKFVNRDLFPWVKTTVDYSLTSYFESADKRLEAAKKRDKQYIEIWEKNTERLAEVEKQMVEISLNMQTILESHRMVTEAFLKIITEGDEVTTQGRLASLLIDEPMKSVRRRRGTGPLKMPRD